MQTINKILDKYILDESPEYSEKRKAARKMKAWLLTVDHESEKIPDKNLDMFSRLLESLKGSRLDNSEWDLVIEIVYREGVLTENK